MAVVFPHGLSFKSQWRHDIYIYIYNEYIMYIGIDMGDIGICDMFPLLWVRRKMGYYPRKSVSMEAIMEAMVHESRSFTL